MNYLKKFWQNEEGMGVIEVVLIIVVLVGLVLIFKSQITGILSDIFDDIETAISKF